MQRKIRVFRNRKGEQLLPIVEERIEGRYEVVAPVSSVRIGETRKDFVRSKACVDYPRWVALFVSKSERECQRWLDRYEKAVLKLCIPYEVR